MSTPTTERPDRYAPEGSMWVCGACGKSQPYDRYGIDDPKGSRGWDESCVLNSFLCESTKVVRNEHGRVTEVAP